MQKSGQQRESLQSPKKSIHTLLLQYILQPGEHDFIVKGNQFLGRGLGIWPLRKRTHEINRAYSYESFRLSCVICECPP